MPSKRTDLVLEPESIHSPILMGSASLSASPPTTASPISPLSPESPSYTRHQSTPTNAIRSPTRSITWDSLLTRARSKSPRPRHQEKQLPSPPLRGSAPLQHSQTSPVPTTPTTSRPSHIQRRHKSDGAIQPQVAQEASTDSSFFQKRPKQKGSLDHYGRHGNDWLFGGISLRETARGLVQKRRDS